MYIQISYPMVDLRPFLETETFQIGVPNWNRRENVQDEFVRHFGHIRIANQFIDYLPNRPYSNAKGALKLPDFHGYNFLQEGKSDASMAAPFPIRRLFVQSRRPEEKPFSCEARFDFGVRIKPAPTLFDLPDLINTEGGIHQAINRLLAYPVSVGSVKGQKRNLDLPIGQMGASIANLYLYSSSQLEKRSEVKKYWVNALQPTIVLQVHNKQGNPVDFIDQIDPQKVLRTFASDQFQLLQFGYQAYGNIIPVWLMVRNGNSADTQRLEKQILWNILEMHTEYQATLELSQLVINDRLKFTPRSPESQRFQYFIRQILRQIQPDENKTNHQQAIFEKLSQDHYELISPEDCLKLMQKLSHIRKNILRDFGNFNLTKTPHSDTPIELTLEDDRQYELAVVEKKHLDTVSVFIQQDDWPGFENHVKRLVAQSELRQCLELMLAFLQKSNISGELANILILQLQRYNRAKRQWTDGFIMDSAYNTLQNRITHSILVHLAEMPSYLMLSK